MNIAREETSYDNRNHDTYHFYYLKLFNPTSKQQITLFETEKFYSALKMTQNLSKATGLNFKDFVKRTTA